MVNLSFLIVTCCFYLVQPMSNLSRKQKRICFSSATVNKFTILSYIDFRLGLTSTFHFKVFNTLHWFIGGLAM